MFELPKYAGIDIGSNAIRLLIATVIEETFNIEVVKNILVRIPIRLGEDVFSSGKISDEKRISLAYAITGFKYIMQSYNVIDYQALATSAMREATNNKEVLKTVLEHSGIAIQVIDGQKEAEIIFSGSKNINISSESDYMYVDVGGGSTEITVFCNNTKVNSRSFPLGTVRILNQGKDENVINELNEWITNVISIHKPNAIIGTGGNINKVQKILNKKPRDPLLYKEIQHLYNRLITLSLLERMEKYKMTESRADVIIPAMEIFLMIMKSAAINHVYVSKVGLADGIIRQLYFKHINKAEKEN
ncbi:MAG: hypothetical protein LUG18_00735 [Candidatus Azobacteroides sp.]|nr:hypothetical protein [Candidatus Azobacteroides sp.]